MWMCFGIKSKTVIVFDYMYENTDLSYETVHKKPLKQS